MYVDVFETDHQAKEEHKRNKNEKNIVSGIGWRSYLLLHTVGMLLCTCSLGPAS